MKQFIDVFLFTILMSNNTNLCEIQTALNDLENVQNNAENIISITSSINDDCVIEFMDTLSSCFIKTGETRYIQTLECFCAVSDGYVSEYFFEISERLLNKSFSNYTNYLLKGNKCLEKYLVTLIQSGDMKNRFQELVKEENSFKSVSSEKINYLNELSQQ